MNSTHTEALRVTVIFLNVAFRETWKPQKARADFSRLIKIEANVLLFSNIHRCDHSEISYTTERLYCRCNVRIFIPSLVAGFVAP
jgi:hypothetical protein